MKKAVAYCRYSSDNQREESIDAQIRAIESFCQREGFILDHVYRDEAKSAMTDKRPGFLQMIFDSNSHEFDLAIVHKLDRFARDRYDASFYRKKLKDNGVQLVSVLENLDNSPESIILESVLDGMAEYYSKNLAREVIKGMKETALQCKHTGGIPPLGFLLNPDKTYSIHPEESIIIRKIFKLYVDGYGTDKISKILNTAGYKTKLGRPFQAASLKDILVNEKYAGVYVYNKRASGKVHNRIYKDASEIIRIDGGMPEIVSKEMFAMAQKKIKSDSKGPRMEGKRYYLLTGLVECGICGFSYTGNGCNHGRVDPATGERKKYPQYKCCGTKYDGCKNPPIRQDILEKYVINTVIEKLFTEEAISELSIRIQDEINSWNKTFHADMKRAEKRMAAAKKKMDDLLAFLLDGIITKQRFSEENPKLECEYEISMSQVEDLNRKAAFSSYDLEKTKALLRISREEILSEDLTVKRKLLEAFVDKIYIYPDHIKAVLRYEPQTSPVDRGNGGGGGGSRTLVRKHVNR